MGNKAYSESDLMKLSCHVKIEAHNPLLIDTDTNSDPDPNVSFPF